MFLLYFLSCNLVFFARKFNNSIIEFWLYLYVGIYTRSTKVFKQWPMLTKSRLYSSLILVHLNHVERNTKIPID